MTSPPLPRCLLLTVAAAAFVLRPPDAASSPAAGDGVEWPAAEIHSIEYLETYSPGETVRAWRGVTAELRVRGQFLDLSTGVEVWSMSGAPATGVSAAITDRSGGSNTYIDIHLTSSRTLAAFETYEVRIRYPLEPTGPDVFRVRLFEAGVVESITSETPASEIREGVPYIFTATGTELSRATLDLSRVEGGSALQTLSRSDTEYRFRLTFTEHGESAISFFHFYDQQLPGPPPPAGRYGGTGHWFATVGINPVVTGVSPTETSGGGRVYIEGSRLQPSGHTIRLGYQDFYRAETHLAVTPVERHADGRLSFFAPSNLTSGSLVLVYEDDGGPGVGVTHVPVEHPLVVTSPPEVQGIEGAPDLTPGSEVFLLNSEQSFRLQGRYLIPAPGRSTTLQVGPLTASIDDLTRSATAGFDVLRFTLPTSQERFGGSGLITVETGSGSATAGPQLWIHHIPAPTVTAVEWLPPSASTGGFVEVDGGTLIRGRPHRFRGRNLDALVEGNVGFTAYERGEVRLGGTVLSSTSQNTGGDDGHVRFTIPEDFPVGSASLSLSHFGGEAVVGTFEVADPPAPATPEEVLFDHPNIVGENYVGVTVRLQDPVSTGTIELTSSNPQVAPVPPSLEVSGPEASFQILVQPGETRETATITASGGGVSRSAELSVSPRRTVVRLSSVRLTETMTRQGPEIHGTVIVTGLEPGSDPVEVSLSSNLRDLELEPARLTIAEGMGEFRVHPPFVPGPTPVSITARSEVGEASASLTLEPPPLILRFEPDEVVGPGATATLTVEAGGPVPDGTEVLLASSHPSLLDVPGQVILGGADARERGQPLQITVTVEERPRLFTNVTVAATYAGGRSPAGEATILVR